MLVVFLYLIKCVRTYINMFLQSTETTSSNAMELEGFKRCRQELHSFSIELASVTTDRHLGIAKYMREEWSEVQHFFDTWHISKGMVITITVH